MNLQPDKSFTVLPLGTFKKVFIMAARVAHPMYVTDLQEIKLKLQKTDCPKASSVSLEK